MHLTIDGNIGPSFKGNPLSGRFSTKYSQSNSADSKGELGRQIKKFTYILGKRKWWALITMAIILAGVALYTQRMSPVYRATSALIIESKPPRVLSGVNDVVELGSNNYWTTREYFQTQYKVIRGIEVCDRVVKAMNLDAEPAFLGAKPNEVLDDAERQRRIVSKTPARTLQSRISVDPVPNSMMVMVSVDDADPQMATDLANEIVLAYRAQNIDYRRAMTQEAYSELQDMVGKYREEKESADQKLLDFEREHSIGSFESRKAALEKRIEMLNEREATLLMKRSDLGARVDRVKKLAGASDQFSVPLDTILNSSLVTSLKTKYVELRDERTSLAVEYGEKHPRILALGGQMTALEQTLQQEVSTYLKVVRGDFEEVVSSLTQTRNLLEDANANLSELGVLQVEYNALAERKKDSSEVYDQIRNRFTEINLSAQIETNNVRIHELAQQPRRPIRPDIRLNLALGLLVGSVLGLGLAFLVEQLDNSVKDREEVERLSQVPCLGIIPSIPGPRKIRRSRRRDVSLSDRDFYVVANPKSVIAEAFNTIRTNLLFAAPDRTIRTLLVTSGSPWEGKSTVVISMGITQARYGAKTLIVDTDMRRPRLHRSFKIEADVGLSNVLVGTASIDQAVVATEFENLHLLPCGPVPPNPSDLLRMERLANLINDLKDRYDTIILDSPPVIPVADPRILSGLVDGVVLVVKLGTTTTEAVTSVSRELEAVKAPLLGTVLNDLDIKRRGYGYRYGYGYGYGQYSYGSGYYSYPSISDNEDKS